MNALTSRFVELLGTAEGLERFFCPGRVNLIGEHIDYLGGSVMPAAISLGITALIRPNGTSAVNMHSTDFDGMISYGLDNLPNSKQGNWGDFVLGVLLHLQGSGIRLQGFDVLFDSNLPKGSGLSSSAALEVLTYYIVYRLNTGNEPDRTRMALHCQQIENRFIGVNCGIMDQFAVANGKADHAMLLNCGTLEHAFVPLHLGDHSLLIINTNRPRALAESAYNQRRRECDEALRIIAEQHPTDHLVNAKMDDLLLISDPILRKRTRHAITEQQRVIRSAEVLRTNDLTAFGKLMTQSHVSLRDDYEVSCAELDFIVDELTSQTACLGARMTGAGFGGCCIALVHSEAVNRFKEELGTAYLERFGREAAFHTCVAFDGVHFIA